MGVALFNEYKECLVREMLQHNDLVASSIGMLVMEWPCLPLADPYPAVAECARRIFGNLPEVIAAENETGNFDERLTKAMLTRPNGATLRQIQCVMALHYVVRAIPALTSERLCKQTGNALAVLVSLMVKHNKVLGVEAFQTITSCMMGKQLN